MSIPQEKQEELKVSLQNFISENFETISSLIPAEILNITSKDPLTFIVTEQLVKFCYSMPLLKLSNRDKLNPHGKQVVDQVQEQEGFDGLGNLIKLWRQNFLLTVDRFAIDIQQHIADL